MPRILTPKVTVLNGDCREVLKTLPDGSANCCVTSPPYFGLRDYGHPGQIGLEHTPEAYVAEMVEVFREVRRVLRDDGTLWLNLGDSYNSLGGIHAGRSDNQTGVGAGQRQWREGSARADGQVRSDGMSRRNRDGTHAPGLKAKDLIGIPWRVAFALQQPYYTGRIADERDRVWLAAMVDAEGSICGTAYETDGRTKTNLYLSVTNTSAAIIAKCEALFPQEVRHVYEKHGPTDRKCFRWDVERIEQKAMFLREIYPHLVAKKKQAILGYTFLEMQRGLASKKKGYLPEQQEQRSWLMDALSRLNAGETVDLPEWVVEPPSLFDPGFYLRQDIIWHKPNPMPESVTDRCTKAHEYIFLLSKSERYWFDSEAMKEDSVKGAAGSSFNKGKTAEHQLGRSSDAERVEDGKRNRRSVWSVATKPYKGAHFATFPPALIEPCILAGCPRLGTVLDPFGGSGTTGQVALSKERSAILVELNSAYIPLINERIEKV